MAPHNRARAASHSAAKSTAPADLPSLHDRQSGSQPRGLNGLTPSPFSSPSPDGDVDEEGGLDGDDDHDHADDDDDDDDDDADFQSHYSLDGPISSGSSESDSVHGDEPVDARPLLHRSNSTFLSANSFAPPFYNRPPTPLPPSPSLTSLLRPSFSTNTSRPTTPDSSENDTPNDTEAAVAKSARTATTVPRASPKVPTYEYYGFVLYLLSSLAFLMYLLWSYLPSPFLHQLGIHYYPDRWWALAIPSFLVMTIVYIYVALASYNTGYLTLPMSSIENIVDDAADIAVIDQQGKIKGRGRRNSPSFIHDDGSEVDWKGLWSEGTDAVMDVPLGGVCQILYGHD